MSARQATSGISTLSPTRPPFRRSAGRLIVLRHGRTAWNADGRFQGQADPPLDETGLAQATGAATALRLFEPDAIVSSDLMRAAATAERIGATCDVAISFDPALREVALGGWEGLTPSAAAAAYPDEYKAWTAGHDVRRGGGETEQEAGERALATLMPVLQSCQAGRTVVVVSHGLVLRRVLRQLGRRVNLQHPVPDVHLDNGDWICVCLEPAP